MPNIKRYESQLLPPGGQAIDVRAPSGAFGGFLGEAIGQAGESARKEGERLIELDRVNQFSTLQAEGYRRLGEIYTRHASSAAPDPDKFQEEVQKAGQELFESVQDAQVRSAWSNEWDKLVARKEIDLQGVIITREKQWQEAALARNLHSFRNQIADAEDDQEIGERLSAGRAAIWGSVAAGAMDPDAAEKIERKWLGDVEADMAKKQILADPDHAYAELLEPKNWPYMDEGTRLTLLDRAQTAQIAEIRRQEHEDTKREKRLKSAQAGNLVDLMSGIMEGQPVTPAEVEELVHKGVIDATKGPALLKWMLSYRDRPAQDDSMVYRYLTDDVINLATQDTITDADTTVVLDKIMHAQLTGLIKPETGLQLSDRVRNIGASIYKNHDYTRAHDMLKAISLTKSEWNPAFNMQQNRNFQTALMQMDQLIEGGMDPYQALAQIAPAVMEKTALAEVKETQAAWAAAGSRPPTLADPINLQTLRAAAMALQAQKPLMSEDQYRPQMNQIKILLDTFETMESVRLELDQIIKSRPKGK